MLSYPDSKRLKELGYPQELKEGDWYYWQSTVYSAGVHELILCCDDCADTSEKNFGLRQENYVRVPTTDGMIEGLGDHIEALVWDAGNKKFFLVATPTLNGRPDPYADEAFYKLVDGYKRVPRSEIGPLDIDQALCELWKKVGGENNA